jgi:hypothetical protein
MEHIHTIAQGWTLEDDFARARAWRQWEVDDLLDVSIPWSQSGSVTIVENRSDNVMIREYETPSGRLRHAVRQTTEDVGAGWVVQPDHVPLFEDFNVPRAVKHAVAGPDDVPAIRHLYGPPDAAGQAWFRDRMAAVGAFAHREDVAVQAWSAFGMDALVWLCGTEGAVLLAVDHPVAFEELLEIITVTDLARTALAAAHPAVDLVVERGWYSSTDVLSPELFDRFLAPRIRRVASQAHRHGKRFAYVMTTGVERMARRLADAGVDVLFFADPVQDRLDLGALVRAVGGSMCLVGGVSVLSLSPGREAALEQEVARAVATLGSTGRFILHPVDALFPDTPERGVRLLLDAWRKHRA